MDLIILVCKTNYLDNELKFIFFNQMVYHFVTILLLYVQLTNDFYITISVHFLNNFTITKSYAENKFFIYLSIPEGKMKVF